MKLLFILMMFTNVVLAKQSFIYETRYLSPLNQEQQCLDRSQNTAQAFSSIEGVTVLKVFCLEDQIHPEYLNGYVRYQAEEELTVTSSVDGGASVENAGPIFLTLQDCKANLPKQVGVFMSATALQPFMALCYERHSYDDFNKYHFRIEAIGLSEVQGRSSGLNIYGKLVTDLLELTQYLKLGFEQYGTTVHSLVLRDYGYSKRATVGYYSSKEIVPYAYLRLSYDHREQCLSSYHNLVSAYSEQQVKPLAMFCENNTAYYNLNIYAPMHLDAQTSFRVWKSSFQSLEACNAAIDSELQEATESLGEPFIAGACGIVGSKVKMYLLKSIPEETIPDD